MNTKYMFLFLLMLGLASCQDDLAEIGDLVAPTNLVVTVDVAEDGSGLVELNMLADGAIIYHFYPGISETEQPIASSSGQLEYSYRSTGVYLARMVAFGPGGLSSNTTVEIDVEVTYEPPVDLLSTLAGEESRSWTWKKAAPAHLGVGPVLDGDGNPVGEPIWYTAQPFEKESEGCLYTDVFTFRRTDAVNTLDFELNNGGVSYFNREEVNAALGQNAPDADQCYDYEVTGTKTVGFFEAATGLSNSTNISFSITDGGFLSYFVGSSTYEIMSYSADEFTVRVIQTTDTGAELAWYHTFEATEADNSTEDPAYELVWSDEFDTDGAPNTDYWSYNIGIGDNGWGNGEAQFYTDRPDNAIVSDGALKIIAKRENFSGSAFTSARLITQDKFEFTYGKIEVRAKLPTGGGTWPAIWMLGADYETNTWPAAGEMDIMEHIGNNQDVIQAAVHSPSSFGDTQNKGELRVNGVSETFHTYELTWTADGLEFGVDGNVYYTYNPAVKNADTYPFNKDFFLILNVAMGGSLGGEIEQSFTESSMEIDYVRVYQLQ